MNRTALLFTFALMLFFSSCNTKHQPGVFDLRCENLHNPTGIDKTVPRFSWKINSETNGTSQAAYQILVASDASILEEGKADFWDSGKVQSPSSVLVAYNGEKLGAGTAATWKVRVWDNNGNVSQWSSPATFGIGLLSPADWQAEYISLNTDKGYTECPQLYKSFEVEGTGPKYILHVNSLGYHEVYVNGKKVGNGVLNTAVSQFNKRSLSNTYDISDFVKKGKNDLLLWLGSGWYTFGLPGVVNDGPVVKAQLEKVEKGNRETIVATGQTWQGRKSSYTRHGNWHAHRFGGEIIDGGMAKNDLQVDNPGNPWLPVSIVDVPPHSVSPQMVETNAIQDTLSPSAVIQTGKDTFLIDMGKNLTGWLDFNFNKLASAQEVKFEYCDHLTDEGKFNDRNQYDCYIASGNAPERFVNKFNYHGFRYVRVSGLDEIPAIDSIKAYLVRTNFEVASGFECSDADLNAIHDMLNYTLQCLSIGGDFVDCPQIERLGYGGDGNASTLTAQTMYNLAPLYNNWLQAWADVVREDGGMPHTAPNPYPAGGGPYWCGFIITASWNAFLNYGDTLVLEKYYPTMQKWLGYVDKYSVGGILKKWPDNDYRGWYLGDWATPTGIDQTAEASVDVVNNSFVAVCLDNMEKIAKVLGKPGDSKMYASKKQELQAKIHEAFFDETRNSYGTGTQIDLAFPMIAGAVPDKKYDEVKKSFFNETEVKWKGHFACGLVGLPVVTEWVVKNQAPDLMYSMLKKRDYPSFLYMIDNGASTTWEHWDGARSRIHNCYNGIGSWFYQALGGIQRMEGFPGYRKVRVQPQIPQGVTWAKTFKETPYGKLAVDWELDGKSMVMDIEIPVGVEAEVVVPDGVKGYILDGKKHPALQENGFVVVGSGKYKISYEL